MKRLYLCSSSKGRITNIIGSVTVIHSNIAETFKAAKSLVS